MPRRDRLAQLLIMGADPSGTYDAAHLVAQYHLGGVFIPRSKDVSRVLDGRLARLATPSGIPAFVAIDDEGGRVVAFDQTSHPLASARQLARSDTPDEVQQLAAQRGQALAKAGITMDLAPVVDVSSQPADAVIGDRSFSADSSTVIRYAGAFAAGLRSAGIIPVLKHFPGHGRATGDSHAGTSTTPSLASLNTLDLVPFVNLLHAPSDPAVMVGHLTVPGLTEPQTPASLSHAAVTGLLRDKLGFDGLILTDDLADMRAISATEDIPHAVRAALIAGVDVALWVIPSKINATLDLLGQALNDGSLPEAKVNRSVARVFATKAFDPCQAHR